MWLKFGFYVVEILITIQQFSQFLIKTKQHNTFHKITQLKEFLGSLHVKMFNSRDS